MKDICNITDDDIRSGRARGMFGLNTNRGSMYQVLRDGGLNDFMAQKIVFSDRCRRK